MQEQYNLIPVSATARLNPNHVDLSAMTFAAITDEDSNLPYKPVIVNDLELTALVSSEVAVSDHELEWMLTM
jgi:hypothetical protein